MGMNWTGLLVRTVPEHCYGRVLKARRDGVIPAVEMQNACVNRWRWWHLRRSAILIVHRSRRMLLLLLLLLLLLSLLLLSLLLLSLLLLSLLLLSLLLLSLLLLSLLLLRFSPHQAHKEISI